MKRRQPNRLWAFLPLASAFVIIVAIAVYGILAPSKARPNPDAPGFRGSLVWGDGIFANRAQLKAWLKLHGASYEAWVKQHPAAVRLVKPPARRPAVVSKPRPHKVVVRSGARHTPAPQTSAERRAAVRPAVHHKVIAHAHRVAAPTKPLTAPPSKGSSHVLLWLIALAWLLIGVLAVLPRSVLREMLSKAPFRNTRSASG